MGDRFDERARELALGLSLQQGHDDGDLAFASTVEHIAAALRAEYERGLGRVMLAEYERGVRKERERWVATLREFVAMMDGDFMGHEPDHNCHISKVTALVLAKKMGVSLDAPDGGEP